MDKVIIAGCEDKGTKALRQEDTKYCILENDGVSLCVCKHRPCEQLQRAKAEIEELKKHQCSFENCDNFERYSTEIHELKQENERLKEELRTEKIYSSQIEELEGSLQHAKAENEELSESIKRLKNMAKAAALGREKYRQALQEIRCVVDKNISFMDTSSTTKAMIRIQDKINEVIGEE